MLASKNTRMLYNIIYNNNILRNKTQEKMTEINTEPEGNNEMPPYEEEDSEGDEVSEEEEYIVAFMPKKKVRERKTNWSNNITDNLIDIILDDEKLKTKLLLTNSVSVRNSRSSTVDIILKLLSRKLSIVLSG